MYYYVGINEERISDTKLFSGSITINGTNINNNYAYNKIYNKNLDYNDVNNIDKMSAFYAEYMWRIIKQDSDAKFMFYSLVDSSKLGEGLTEYIVWRGIGGIDYIINNNKVYFMEINPRFQASSTKLNDILISKGYEDIYTLNLKSFYSEEQLPCNIEN